MLSAHLPSGYLLARGIGWPGKAVLATALIGAVLPDFDMLWFYFVDHGSTHHHRYWPHVPAFWAIAALPVLGLALWMNNLRLGLVFLAAIALHLILDSISGGILWGWPANDRLMSLVTVPATHDHWILSFVFHWTFLLELAIWGATLTLIWRERNFT